jgi:LPS-assembly lipoprotein
MRHAAAARCLLLLLTLGLALQACGFRLRGSVEMPPQLQQTVAEGVAAYSELGEALSRSWRQSGAQLYFDRQGEVEMARLVIKRDEVTRRTLSVDSAGRPNEYQLRYQVSFSLQDAAGAPLLADQNVSANRAYQFDPANILAMDDEEARLKKVLAEEAALQMLRRITFQLRNRPPEPPATDPAADGSTPANGEPDETAR